MIIKTYQKYIIKNFLTCFAIVLLVFTCLVFILNIFEEVNFLQDKKNSFYYAVILTLLNIPSLIYEISPFIFFASLIEKVDFPEAVGPDIKIILDLRSINLT